MGIPNNLITDLIKVTNDKTEQKKESTVYGTIVDHEKEHYVRIDGSELLTPISSTAAVENGDRVIVMIKNHTATVTGNISSPSASNKDVAAIGDQIAEFEIIIADKISVKEFEAQVGRIDELVSDNIFVKDTLTANKAEIDELKAKDVEITGQLTANKAEIDDLTANKLDAEIADIKYATIESLQATDANIHNLIADFGEFKKLTAEDFTAINGTIENLDTKYADIEFSNIGKAAIENLFADSGLIKDLIVGDGTITGELVGVTIKGDLIEGNTIVADKLVIKGSDGLYYKLNTDGITTEAEQTEYNSLNGSVITAKSIAATKISVSDLVAFDATIGGFKLTTNSIYSGVKESIDNTTRGVYLDKNGQIVFGDTKQYIKYYEKSDGNYELDISAQVIRLSSSNMTIEESIEELRESYKADLKVEQNKITSIVQTTNSLGDRISEVEQTADGLVVKVDNLKDASKVATNFLSYDSTNGVQVGNKSNGSWSGTRARIKPSAFEIVNSDETVLASYAANRIDLGKNSKSSVIGLCGNAGSIDVGKFNGYESLTINSNAIALASKDSIYLSAYDPSGGSNSMTLFKTGTTFSVSGNTTITTINYDASIIKLKTYNPRGNGSELTLKPDGTINANVVGDGFLINGYGPLLGNYINGYYGMMRPDRNHADWIRTTQQGIIPYQNGGASSLGTSSWPFANIHANNIYDNGVLLENKFFNLRGFTTANLDNIRDSGIWGLNGVSVYLAFYDSINSGVLHKHTWTTWGTLFVSPHFTFQALMCGDPRNGRPNIFVRHLVGSPASWSYWTSLGN